MRRALVLAGNGCGHTSPNPMVGCVIVKNDRIIGEGWHAYCGGLHAERNALKNCTEDPSGADLYVTLEPCCHYGKTPPCTEAIIQNKIRKVYVGCMDPNPKVAGKGVEILRKQGMKQRLCLARALIHDPQFLILDEPASGLDPRSRFEFKEILKELRDNGKTIIISSHILMELAEMCTSIGIIERGKMILQGSIEDILETVDTSNPLIIRVYDQVDTAVLLLKKEEKIESLTIRGNSIFASFSGNREEEARLLKTLIDNGVLVQSFSREQGSLESLFLKITEHSEEAG